MTTHQAYRSSTAPTSAARSVPATFQTRIRDYQGMDPSAGDDLLSDYAYLYGGIERKHFAQVAAGRSSASLKSEYLKRYGIPARMFNGVRVSLEGKVASVREQQKLRVDNLARRIARARGQIAQGGDNSTPALAAPEETAAGQPAIQAGEAGRRYGVRPDTVVLWVPEALAKAVQSGSQRLRQS